MMEDKTLEIVERLARIETMLESLNMKASTSDLNALKDRVEKLESSNMWLIRGFGGTIIIAIMSAIGKFL